MLESIQFFVPGKPVPGGSKDAFPHPVTGRIIVTDAAGEANADWKKIVHLHALQALSGRQKFFGAIEFEMDFFIKRPQSHYHKVDGVSALKEDAPLFHLQKPDTTKLVRSTEDGLTGALWEDDCIIPSQVARKHWCEREQQEGVYIKVELIRGEEIEKYKEYVGYGRS